MEFAEAIEKLIERFLGRTFDSYAVYVANELREHPEERIRFN